MDNLTRDREALENLLNRTQDISQPPGAGPVFPESEDFAGSFELDSSRSRLDLFRTVHLRVRVELGRVSLALKDVLAMAPGSVVDLGKLADDPVEIFVGDNLIARGQVIVVSDGLCVRITEVLATGEPVGEE